MPSFRYRAVSRTGEALSGTLDVADRSAAIARLQSLGHVPLTTEQLDPGSLRALLSRDLFSRERLSGRSLADLIQQLGTLVGAGITVEQALALLAGSNAAGREQQVAAELLRRLRAGGSLADGMAAQPKLFPPISVSMVRAGEASGALETTLARLGQYLKRAEAARQAVRSAMVYPAILTFTAFASVALILTVVLPQLRPLFHDAGGHLPVATQIALFLSDALRAWWWAIALAIAAAIAVTHRALADPAIRARRDAALLRLPIIGDTIRRAQAARFTRTLGALVGGGVALSRAIALAQPVLSNAVIADAVAKVATSMREGGGLADPLARTGFFPDLAIQMIRIGEATGKLDEMLLKQADIFDADVQRMTERGLAIMVPALTIGLGLMVAGIIASVMLAILGINDLAG